MPWRRAWQPIPVFLSVLNSMDRGAWGATVHWVAKSQTLLKWLSMAWHGPPTPTFIRIFIINCCWILSNAFSESIEMIMRCFFSFVDMVYYIDWLAYTEPSLWPWLWLQLGCSVLFLCATRFCLLILCWEFLHLHPSKILSCNFLFWWCFVVVIFPFL